VRGAVGSELWRDGIEHLLRAVETALSFHCLAELEIAPRAALALLPRGRREERHSAEDALLDRVDEDAYRKIWGSWLGRERELFVRCARIVGELSWRDVIAIAGPDVKLLAASTRELHRAVRSKAIPPRLEVGKFRVLAAHEGGVRVEGYSDYDPIEVPAELFRVLHRFDGRPTRQVRAELAAEDGVELDDAFLRTLVDFQILVADQRDRADRADRS
jgi:hypothetical protein